MVSHRHNNTVFLCLFILFIDEVQILRTNYPKMTSFLCKRSNDKSDIFTLSIFSQQRYALITLTKSLKHILVSLKKKKSFSIFFSRLNAFAGLYVKLHLELDITSALHITLFTISNILLRLKNMYFTI